jgi:ribonucleoside-triphosphate reductase
VYSTPAESVCKRFRDCFADVYGVVEGVSDKLYFVNSFHTPPSDNVKWVDRVRNESEFVTYTKGGFISYVELPNTQGNLQALEYIIKWGSSIIPYFAINTPSDYCYDCNWTGEISINDPVCGCCGNDNPAKMKLVKRVSGYLTATRANSGKWQEWSHRTINK